MNDDLTAAEKREATILALEMYDTFASELLTALKNLKSIKDALCFKSVMESSPQERSYYEGQKDALEEVVDRIGKEYYLAKQKADYYKYDEQVFKEIRFSKNMDVDKVINENSIRGRYQYPKVHRFKGKLADLLEAYGVQGFILGEKYRYAKNVEVERKLIYDFVDATNKAADEIEPLDANDIP